MEVTIQAPKTQSFTLNHQTLSALIPALPDNADHQPFYSELVTHPSTQVRTALAGKETLTPEAIHQLAQDPSSPVLEQLLYNPSAQAELSVMELAGIFSRSSSAAEIAAYRLDDFQDPSTLSELLSNHPDPAVRLALVQNSSLSKAVRSKLVQDPDPLVAQTAQEGINR
jgi:hypothetical protein